MALALTTFVPRCWAWSATHPPQANATLRASKVAALLVDALGPRARMQLLDHLILLLAEADGEPSPKMRRASDTALVLLLLDANNAEPETREDDALPGSVEAKRAPRLRTPADGSGATEADWLAEIADEADRAIAAASAERRDRYEKAASTGSLADAMLVIHEAAADEDREQAWSLFKDVVSRHQDARPDELVTVASDVLGPEDLEGDGEFDGLGAGIFTVLSPVPTEAAAAMASVATRLLNVDDRGTEHHDYETAADLGLHRTSFTVSRGATEGPRRHWIPRDRSSMARTMIAILRDSLVQNRVPAVFTGLFSLPTSQ